MKRIRINIKSERVDKSLSDNQLKRISDRIKDGIKRNNIAKEFGISDTSLKFQLGKYESSKKDYLRQG